MRDQAQQPRAAIVDGDVEEVAAQLQPQPQPSPGAHDRVGDQLVSEQLSPVEDVLVGQGEPPVWSMSWTYSRAAAGAVAVGARESSSRR